MLGVVIIAFCVASVALVFVLDWRDARAERQAFREYMEFRRKVAHDIAMREIERRKVEMERARQYPHDRAAAIAAFKAHGGRAQQKKSEN